MAIKPVGDIAREVQAADPQAAASARAPHATRASETFAASLPRDPAPRLEPAKDGGDAFRRFEAMVLGQFVEAMLPKDAETAFGGGLAGDMWRSLAAEKIAGEIAERGGVGIARQLLRDHYRDGGNAVPLGAVDGTQTHGRADEARVGRALIEELEQRALAGLEHAAPDAAAARRAGQF